MRQYGFLTPVVVDGNNVLVAGHGRVAAAREIGLEQVPTICADHLSPAQRRAYMLADNKIAELGSFDEEQLAVEFEYLYGLPADRTAAACRWSQL